MHSHERLLVIFVVLSVRLYSYRISYGVVFMFACTSDMCIKLLLTYLLITLTAARNFQQETRANSAQNRAKFSQSPLLFGTTRPLSYLI